MMAEFQARRSLLYVPGSNERALIKAPHLGADMIVYDLEDAVAPAQKAEARERVAEALAGAAGEEGCRAVRINGLDSAWGEEDLAVFAAAPAAALLVPKVNEAGDLEPVQRALDEAGSRARIWAMLETPLAVLEAQHIAAAAKGAAARLELLVMGLNDLALEMRLPAGGLAARLGGARDHCVLAARAFGLDIIDGVCNNFGDEAGLRAECADGRRRGFDGKSLIHPAQIGPCHELFSPSEAEIAHARKILLAFEGLEADSQGAIAMDGVMVEALHLAAARRVLALSGE